MRICGGSSSATVVCRSTTTTYFLLLQEKSVSTDEIHWAGPLALLLWRDRQNRFKHAAAASNM
jgi:hypothetical protein